MVVYITGLFSAVRQHCPLAPAPRSCASPPWKDDSREMPSVWHGCWNESCLFSVTGMCLSHSLVGNCCCYLSMHSFFFLPNRLEEAWDQAVSSRGHGKQRVGMKGENLSNFILIGRGSLCVSGARRLGGVGVKWRVGSRGTPRFLLVCMMMLMTKKRMWGRGRYVGQGN